MTPRWSSFCSYLVIFPATLFPFCQSGSPFTWCRISPKYRKKRNSILWGPLYPSPPVTSLREGGWGGRVAERGGGTGQGERNRQTGGGRKRDRHIQTDRCHQQHTRFSIHEVRMLRVFGQKNSGEGQSAPNIKETPPFKFDTEIDSAVYSRGGRGLTTWGTCRM